MKPQPPSSSPLALPRRSSPEGADWTPEALAERRMFLRAHGVAADLAHVAGASVDPASARGNVEGMIGFAQVPVGVAWPLVLRGDFAGHYAVPFATSEGTLVASYQRGFRVAAEAGGVSVRVLREGYALFPLFAYESVDAALEAGRWLDAHRGEVEAVANATTAHGRVTELGWELLGRRLLVTLRMDTGDAQGANMVNRAVSAIVPLFPGGPRVLLHGYDAEKRASTRHWRGRWVLAELVVPGELVRRRWRTTPEALAELWADYQLAYARMGTANHALQVANGLAAIYTATGQDAAYVAESCAGTLSLEAHAGDLHASLDLPSLHAATVGGGTRKGTAAECQALTGAKSARELAGVMAGALLCGDVNLAASFLGDDFAAGHERLGRNR
jgi:hydroxymethylglutaryl-CoA reductase (NADPH)